MTGEGVSAVRLQLEHWARAHHHDGATATDVRAMPGHAGLSFGFDVVDAGGIIEQLVVRMPPKGVRRSGNTDVIRQVPLLVALAAAGVPVAEVAWWDDDERWFGVPYFMVRLLPGETYQVRDPSPAFAGVSCSDVMRAAVEALALVHRVDHHAVLPDWEHPRALAQEVSFWDPIQIGRAHV